MPKIGRNDPCPCGSGKKYKQCHLPIEEAAAAEQLRLRRSVDTLLPKVILAAQAQVGAIPAAFDRFWDGKYTAAQLQELDDLEGRGGERFLTWFAFDYPLDNDGNLQDTTRGETQIGWRGHIVRMEPGRRPRSIGSIGDRDAMKGAIKPGEWTRLHVIARGNTLSHLVNGQLMAVVIDDDASFAKAAGVIALQIEQYGTGRVSLSVGLSRGTPR